MTGEPAVGTAPETGTAPSVEDLMRMFTELKDTTTREINNLKTENGRLRAQVQSAGAPAASPQRGMPSAVVGAEEDLPAPIDLIERPDAFWNAVGDAASRAIGGKFLSLEAAQNYGGQIVDCAVGSTRWLLEDPANQEAVYRQRVELRVGQLKQGTPTLSFYDAYKQAESDPEISRFKPAPATGGPSPAAAPAASPAPSPAASPTASAPGAVAEGGSTGRAPRAAASGRAPVDAEQANSDYVDELNAWQEKLKGEPVDKE